MKRFVIYIMLLVFILFPCCESNTSKDTLDYELIKKFNHYYFEHFANDPSIRYGTKFLGVVVMQNPADMWIMQELISDIRPDFIIETGTAAGGSALYYATILKEVNKKGRVITIDIKPLVKQYLKRLKDNPALYRKVEKIFDNYVEVVTANSVDPQLIKRLKVLTKDKKVIVTLDSCHNYEHVLKELILYSEMVSPGSYIIVQDTFLDEKEEWVEKYCKCPGYTKKGGPKKAAEEFLRRNHDFKVSKLSEKFFFTSYPSGYLKKHTSSDNISQ